MRHTLIRGGRRFLLVAALSLVLGPVVARADARVRWFAPEGCLDAEGLQTMFEAAVGAPLEAAGAPGTTIDVHFDREPSRVGVRVRIEGPSGVRERALTIDGEDCRRLDEGLIVIVALLLDEVAEERARETHTIRLPQAADSGPDGEPRTVRGAIALGATARIDSLPGLAGGAYLAFNLRPLDELVLELSVAGFPGVDAIQPDGVGARVHGGAVSLGGCGLARVASFFELGGCGHVWVTGILAAGLGFEGKESSVGGEIAGAIELRMGLALAGPVWLRGGVGFGVSVIRTQVHVLEAGVPHVIHESAPVYPAISLALELRLGE